MSFEIREIHYDISRPDIALNVDSIQDLPYALKRLAELGHDMAPSLAVLQEAVEEQRKQKVLQAAINAIADPVKK